MGQSPIAWIFCVSVVFAGAILKKSVFQRSDAVAVLVWAIWAVVALVSAGNVLGLIMLWINAQTGRSGELKDIPFRWI
jgi:hypothetical protein